jgi:hypothetical protein
MGRDNFADKFTLAFRDYCSAQPGWNAKEVPQPGAQVGSLFCLGVCEMEDDYSVDRRKVSPRRFGEWITEYTQRLRFRKVEAEGGYFELDRARQVGNLDDWTIDGQWHSENGALPPVPTVTSGKCTLIQFSLTQLDDGRQYEEPRSKILSWRVGGLPALEVLFAENPRFQGRNQTGARQRRAAARRPVHRLRDAHRRERGHSAALRETGLGDANAPASRLCRIPGHAPAGGGRAKARIQVWPR